MRSSRLLFLFGFCVWLVLNTGLFHDRVILRVLFHGQVRNRVVVRELFPICR